MYLCAFDGCNKFGISKRFCAAPCWSSAATAFVPKRLGILLLYTYERSCQSLIDWYLCLTWLYGMISTQEKTEQK